MISITPEDFNTNEGRQKIAEFLNGMERWKEGVHEHLMDLTFANQEKLISMGKAYAKPENLGH